MSGYQDALAVEARGREALSPFLTQRAYEGRLVWTTKGRLSEELQKTAGDLVYNSDADTVVACEIKVEERWTGNVFLERWSNRPRWKAGWLETLSTDLLLYYFLESDQLLVLHFENLRRWLYNCESGCKPPSSNFPHVLQRKNAQLNQTWGYLVSVAVMPQRTVLVGRYQPQTWLRNADWVGAA